MLSGPIISGEPVLGVHLQTSKNLQGAKWQDDESEDDNDIEWAAFESPVAGEGAQSGRVENEISGTEQNKPVERIRGLDSGTSQESRPRAALGLAQVMYPGQHERQDPEDDDSDGDLLLGAAGWERNRIFGDSGYTKLGSRSVHAVKTEAKRGKDRALSLMQVLSVSMDTREVENAAEQLRRQLGTRPYGNAPHAGEILKSPMDATIYEHMKIVDSWLYLLQLFPCSEQSLCRMGTCQCYRICFGFSTQPSAFISSCLQLRLLP